MNRLKIFVILIFGVWYMGGGAGIAAEDKAVLPELPDTNARISMDFRDADLKDVLKIFSQQAGMNFIPSDDMQDKKITLYLEDVPVKNAIKSIIQANGLTYEQGPDKNIFIVRPSGVVKIKTITRIYTLNFSQVSPLAVAGSPMTGEVKTETGVTVTSTAGIVDILNKLLTPAGNIVADQRTNSLIITDIPEQFKVIEELIRKLDTPTPQVFIEAEIIETTTDVTDKLGLEYGGSTGSWSATYGDLQRSYAFPYDAGAFKGHGATGTFTFGTLTFGDLSLTLKALTSHANTKYLARPRLLTLNNEAAVIEITSDTFVGQVTTAEPQTATTTTSAERIPTGVSLKVTPQVNMADYVTMILEPSVSRTEPSTVNSNFLNPVKRSAKAKVMVKDGETVFIGGLLDTQKSNTKKSVPILSKIPIVGVLFKSDTVTDEQTEILIFITPHIVKNTVVREVKAAPLAGNGDSLESARSQLIDRTIKKLEKQ